MKLVPILHSFIRQDWVRFNAFWFKGIWKHVPFVIISKTKLRNMHHDISDNAVCFTAKTIEESAKCGKGGK